MNLGSAGKILLLFLRLRYVDGLKGEGVILDLAWGGILFGLRFTSYS